MSNQDPIEFLENERSKLIALADHIDSLYETLSASFVTLTIPFRVFFMVLPDEMEKTVERKDEIVVAEHRFEGAEGQIQKNTTWLTQIVSNIKVIRGCLKDPGSLPFDTLTAVRKAHSDMHGFMDGLYSMRVSPARSKPESEMQSLAQEKRNDIENLLREHLEPFWERLTQIQHDLHSARLRAALKDDAVNCENHAGSPDRFDLYIKSRCTDYGIPYAREVAETAVSNLNKSDEAVLAALKNKYEERKSSGEVARSRRQERLLKVTGRYLARLDEVSKLIPILKKIRALFQPEPTFWMRLVSLVLRLFAQETKARRVDVEYSYIIGGEKIQRKTASLAELIDLCDSLEKDLLRAGNSFDAKHVHGDRALDALKSFIQSVQIDLRKVYEDSFGLMQWLGRKHNARRLERFPQKQQRELNNILYTINATLIINREMLREVADKDLPAV